MNNIVKDLYESDLNFIIYKTKRDQKNFEIFTDFDQEVNLDQTNYNSFLTKLQRYRSKLAYQQWLGFFGYELLCHNIGVTHNGHKDQFPLGKFYHSNTKIILGNKIKIFSKNKIKFFKKLEQSKKKKIFPKKDKMKVNLTKKNYSKIFNVIKKEIISGNTYQIKISQKYFNKSSFNPTEIFWKLFKSNPSPEAFMMRDKNFFIISCSPETLFEIKDNIISTFPIAGTMKKTKNSSIKSAKQFFLTSEKEDKEHNMIIDLERNDLNTVCLPNSVNIHKKKYVSEFKDIYHYITQIKGKLKKDVQFKNIVAALMPGGSVIGCPKISTLKIINKVECQPRRVYTGSFGIFRSKNDNRFNIIIRSLLNYKNINQIFAASGVTIDSNYQYEYRENYLKAKALIDLI